MLHLFCVFFFLPKSDKYVFNFLYVNVFFCTCYEKENKNIKKKVFRKSPVEYGTNFMKGLTLRLVLG